MTRNIWDLTLHYRDRERNEEDLEFLQSNVPFVFEEGESRRRGFTSLCDQGNPPHTFRQARGRARSGARNKVLDCIQGL